MPSPLTHAPLTTHAYPCIPMHTLRQWRRHAKACATDACLRPAVPAAGWVACAEVAQATGSHSRAVPGELPPPRPRVRGGSALRCSCGAAFTLACVPLAQVRHRVCGSASTVRADCGRAPARATGAAGARASSARLAKLPRALRQPAQLGHDSAVRVRVRVRVRVSPPSPAPPRARPQP